MFVWAESDTQFYVEKKLGDYLSHILLHLGPGGYNNRTSDKRVALFFLNLDILTKWEKEPRVTFIPKQTMEHIWNTKYVSPSLLYQFHFMGVTSSHIIFSFLK